MALPDAVASARALDSLQQNSFTMPAMRGNPPRALVLATGSVVAVAAAFCTVPASAQTASSPHPVGVVTETFVDRSRPTAANGDCDEIKSRTLPTTIYYPAAGAPASAAAQPNATPDTRGGPYPLIVFAHGFSATARTYKALLEQWASRGYVVAAPTFPLSSGDSPCGPIAGDSVNQPEDLSHVIDSALRLSRGGSGALAGLVDADRIGAAGHSNGAITTWGLLANTAVRDPRVDAGIVMAGTLQRFPKGRYDFTRTPPLLIVHGSDDVLVPYERGVTAFNAARGPKGMLTVTAGDHGSSAGGKVYSATTDFLDAYVRGDAQALARLPTDQVAGVTTMQFDAKKGSNTTIPTMPQPELHLEATVTPRKNLTGGQVVTVRWRGYTPGKVVNILQCNSSNRDLGNSTECDFANAKILLPNPIGDGETQLTIVEGPVGNGVCDAAHPGCFIVINNASSPDPRDSVMVDITFKKRP
jgi:dienelactone hydrolase